jgi:hypothetical protein
MKSFLQAPSRLKPAAFLFAAALTVTLISACSGGGGDNGDQTDNSGTGTTGSTSSDDSGSTGATDSGNSGGDPPPPPPADVPPAGSYGAKYDLATYSEAGGNQVNRQGTWVAVGTYTSNGITYQSRQVFRIKPSTELLRDTLEMCSGVASGMLTGSIPSDDTFFSIPAGIEFTALSTTDMTMAVNFSVDGAELTGDLHAHKISPDPDVAVGLIWVMATTIDYDGEAGPVAAQLFNNESFSVRCFGEAESSDAGPSIFEIYAGVLPDLPGIEVARRHSMNIYFGNNEISANSETFVSPDGQHPQGHLFSLEKDVDDNDDNDLTRNEFNAFAAMENMTIRNLWDQRQQYQSRFDMQQLDYLSNGHPPFATGNFILDAFWDVRGN